MRKTEIEFGHDGETFCIVHNASGRLDEDWGEFTVYVDDDPVADFAIWEARILTPRERPAEVPCTNDELIRFAKNALENEGYEAGA